MKTAAEALGKDAFFAYYQDDKWKEFSNRVRRFHAGVCASCRASNKVTQVHHWKYYPGRKPWEYELGEVVLVCADCHRLFHKHLQDFRQYIFPRVTPQAFAVLNGALAVALTHYDALEFMYALASLAASPGSVKRFCQDFINSKPKRAEPNEQPNTVPPT